MTQDEIKEISSAFTAAGLSIGIIVKALQEASHTKDDDVRNKAIEKIQRIAKILQEP